MVKIGAAGVVVAFVLFYVLTSPDNAAAMAHGAWNFVTYLAHGIGRFLDKLAA